MLACEIDPGFTRRAEVILSWVQDYSHKKKIKILDAGCGRGFYTYCLTRLCPTAEIVALDASERYLKEAKTSVDSPRVKWKKGDLTHLPFPSGTFDLIICSEVLEHVDDDQKALRELYRVLTSSGTLLLSVPHAHYPLWWDPANWLLERVFRTHLPSHIWWLSGIWADHRRLYTEEELSHRLTASLFVIKDVRRTLRYCVPFSHFMLYGIGKNIVEQGWLPSLHRFHFNQPPSQLVRVIKKFTFALDTFNHPSFPSHTSFLNLVLKVTKN